MADVDELLAHLERSRGDAVAGGVRTRWADAIASSLEAGAFVDDVRAAIDECVRRGLGPKLLPEKVGELRGRARKAPVRDRASDQVGDDELTPEVLDELLGPDVKTMPAPPDEVLNGRPEAYQAWHAEQRQQRLAERRTEARRVLDRQREAS